MSGIPPKIPASATAEGLHTPSHEWASQTTSALGPDTINIGGSSIPTTGELQSKNPKYQHSESTNVDPKSTDEVVSKNSKYRHPEELTSSSTTSTPGIPGAYHEDRSDSQDQSFSLSDTATKVSHTVQSTAQKAGETAAQYLPKSVVASVSAYMPASLSPTTSTIRASSHDIAHIRSLPSSELTGTQPGEHVSGVGSLPGNLSEVSVGKLPDESSEIDQYASSKEIPEGEGWDVGGVVAGAAVGVGATVGSVYESVKSAVSGQPSDADNSQIKAESEELKLPPGTKYTEVREQKLHQAAVTHEHEHEPAHPVRPFESLPSEEFPSTSRGGVGSLPGSTDEPGVAKLPDEKKESGEGWGVGVAMAGAAAGVGATVGGVYEAVKSRVSGHPKVDATKESTLPSTEEPSTSPVGVGSLPGDIHELGVAQLPDEPERKRSLGITGATDPSVGTHPHAHDITERDLPSHEGGLSRAPVGGIGSLPGDMGEEGVGLLPGERAASGESKPLQKDLEEQKKREEYDEQRGRALATGVGGVGAAKQAGKDQKGRPGIGETRRSTGEVAKSPEEALGAPVSKGRRASEGTGKGIEGGVRDEAAKKSKQKKKDDQAMAAGVGAGVAAGAAAVAGGHALGEKEEEGKELRDEGDAKPQSEKMAGGRGEPIQGAGYDTDYHPAELHPLTKPLDTNQVTPTTEGGLGASELQKKVSGPCEQTAEKEEERPAREGVSEKAHEMKKGDEKSGKGHEKAKKVGFMEKMKGEAKMLIGKVEGGKKGEEKVEEGRKIKNGEAQSASSAKA